MAAVNYYLGATRGMNANPYNVTAGTSTVGTAADVEVRIQINNGSNATGITKKDVYHLLDLIRRYIVSNGLPAGTDLPAL